jgi:hypothetical protein
MKHGYQNDIARATKRAHAAAKRSGRPITWQQARRLGVLWCAKMWPLAFEEHPLIEWRKSLHVLKASA